MNNYLNNNASFSSLKENDLIKIWNKEGEIYILYKFIGRHPTNFTLNMSDNKVTYIDQYDFDHGYLLPLPDSDKQVFLFNRRVKEEYEKEILTDKNLHKLVLYTTGIYGGIKDTCVFQPCEDEYDDQYVFVDDITELLKIGVLTKDDHIFQELKFDSDDHFLYNKLMYTKTIIIDIDSIVLDELDTQLIGWKMENLSKQVHNTFLPPICVKSNTNGTYSILNGRHRLQYSKNMEFTKIPVIVS
tara:strand:+ start:1480 stop:2208 length:729 start_codon:yes stop_codon:yes gene_type:complete